MWRSCAKIMLVAFVVFSLCFLLWSYYFTAFSECVCVRVWLHFRLSLWRVNLWVLSCPWCGVGKLFYFSRHSHTHRFDSTATVAMWTFVALLFVHLRSISTRHNSFEFQNSILLFTLCIAFFVVVLLCYCSVCRRLSCGFHFHFDFWFRLL